MIEKITIKLAKSDTRGIFHDTRGDVAALAKTCSILINKLNELVDKVNKLEKSK